MIKPQRRRQNLWIDTDAGFIGAAWYWPTRIGPSPTAVVLVPGIIHEEQRMNGGLVALAESLAHAGLPALLIDLHGSAQSAGQLDNADIGTCWRDDIRAAIRYARDSGAARIIVVGVRLGVPLVFEALADDPPAALIAWAPIASGKRYLRELKVMQRTTDVEAAAPGVITIAGFSIPAPVSDYISTLDLTRIASPAMRRILVRDAPENLDAPWVARLGADGSIIEQQASGETHPWLFGDADQPDLPHGDILALTRWCRTLHDEQAASAAEPAPRRPDQRRTIEFVHRGRMIRETFVEIGPSRMTGVLSEPAQANEGRAARLLMTTVGPGRMFTDFARDEAARGNSSLRFDFAGFRTSGRGDVVQGGAFYGDCDGDDVEAAIDHLRQAGHRRIYAFGFCAGAWAMMKADVAPELCAVAAINVALYRQPGAAMPDRALRARRRLARIAPALARNALLRRVVARSRRRTGGRACQPVEWLTRLCDAHVPVLLAYAEQDPGLEYLNSQMAMGFHDRLHRPFELKTYSGLGHLAEGQMARKRLFRDIAAFFADLDREAYDMRERLQPHRPDRILRAASPSTR